MDTLTLNSIYESCLNDSYNLVETLLKSSPREKYDILHMAIRGACRGGHITLFKRIHSHNLEWWWWSRIIIDSCYSGNRELIKLVLELANYDEPLMSHEWDYILQCVCMNIQGLHTSTEYEKNANKRVDIIKDLLNYVTMLNKTRSLNKPIHIDYIRICTVARFYNHWQIVAFLFSNNLCFASLHRHEVVQLLNVMPTFTKLKHADEILQKRLDAVNITTETLDKIYLVNNMSDVNLINIITSYVPHDL